MMQLSFSGHGDPYDYIGVDKDGLFGIEMGITGVPGNFYC
ncbi:MAG: hypothetical protein CM15mP109_04220 [Candidatus Dadabacteria bacterium]|nr:MAG: hypothetical protein CM15mP109_04220 [Candidatus Dadabacteria bacterium]